MIKKCGLWITDNPWTIYHSMMSLGACAKCKSCHWATHLVQLTLFFIAWFYWWRQEYVGLCSGTEVLHPQCEWHWSKRQKAIEVWVWKLHKLMYRQFELFMVRKIYGPEELTQLSSQGSGITRRLLIWEPWSREHKHLFSLLQFAWAVYWLEMPVV